MASDERPDVGTLVREGECTPRAVAEAAKATQESGSRGGGLKDLTNFSGGIGGVKKRSTSNSMGLRSKPAQLKSDLRDFFYESKVHNTADGPAARKESEDGSLDLVNAAKEDGIDGVIETTTDKSEMVASGSVEKAKEDDHEVAYTRLFTGQNEHSSRTFRRTQSQYEDVQPLSRKRPSLDGEEKASDEATERKRSCAIVLADDSTVDVDPEGDDDVFERPSATSLLARSTSASFGPTRLLKDGSPMSEHGMGGEGGHVVMHQRVNFERTLSASVLERGEFAPPLRDHPHLPALPNIVYELPLVPSKECQVHSVAFGCISAATLAAEMRSMGMQQFQHKYVLIDCRYPYEYEGGHIRNAINLHDNANLVALFYPTEEEQSSVSILDGIDNPASDASSSSSSMDSEGAVSAVSAVPPPHRRIPVFYCEYSQKRGPTMAHDLRSIDRRRNIDRYPDIDYDVMYVLECGYRNFYKIYNETDVELFSPHCAYVEMLQEKKQLGKFKAHRKRGRAHKLQHTEAAAVMSPTTPGVPKEGRRASMVAREKIRETLSARLGGAKARLHFESEEEKSPVKKKEGVKETDL